MRCIFHFLLIATGLTLYRALLKECLTIQLQPRVQENLQHLIRTKFRNHSKICSPRTIIEALTLGYEV